MYQTYRTKPKSTYDGIEMEIWSSFIHKYIQECIQEDVFGWKTTKQIRISLSRDKDIPHYLINGAFVDQKY